MLLSWYPGKDIERFLQQRRREDRRPDNLGDMNSSLLLESPGRKHRERRPRRTIYRDILRVAIEKPGIAKQGIIRKANLDSAGADLYLSELLEHGMLTRVKMYFQRKKIWRYFVTRKGVRYVILVTELEEMLLRSTESWDS